MSDVRLTITDPLTGEVYPVAGNEKGELKLEEPILVEGPPGEKGDPGDPGDPFSGNFADDVTFGAGMTWGSGEGTLFSDGRASFHGGSLTMDVATTVAYKFALTMRGHIKSGFYVCDPRLNPDNDGFDDDVWSSFQGLNQQGTRTCTIWGNGAALFSGSVVVGSRGAKWTIVESGGIAHLSPYTESKINQAPSDDFPELRNIPAEIDQHKEVLELLRVEVQKIEEKLRIAPEAGWNVWDGSD